MIFFLPFPKKVNVLVFNKETGYELNSIEICRMKIMLCFPLIVCIENIKSEKRNEQRRGKTSMNELCRIKRKKKRPIKYFNIKQSCVIFAFHFGVVAVAFCLCDHCCRRTMVCAQKAKEMYLKWKAVEQLTLLLLKMTVI